MKANQLTGFTVSAVLHAGLVLLLLPLLWANEQKLAEPDPILLELTVFEPPPPPPIVVEPALLPEPLAKLTPEPVAELVSSAPLLPAPEPLIEKKKPEPPPPKKEKMLEPPKPKPKPKPVAEEKQPAPAPESKPVIEQALAKPEPQADPALLRRQKQEKQRLIALREQGQREFVEKQLQEQERQRLEQQRQQEQAKRRAEWEQAQHREAIPKQQAEAKAKAKLEQQRVRAIQTTATAQPKQPKLIPVSAASSSNQALPMMSNPRYRSPPSPPEYPRRALEAGIEGTVLVRVILSAEGGIMDVLVHQSSGHASLDAAALKAVRAWSFMPAQRDGKAIPAVVQLPVRFKLS